MNREEHLDDLIEQYLHGDAWQVDAREDEAASLAAAGVLARLNELEAPPGMAERIEARVRAKARVRQNHNGRVFFIASPPRAEFGRRRRLYRPPWLIALTTAAVLVLACLGVVHAASNSLPGDLLYGLKQFEQQVALANVGSPADRARLQVSQLQGAIADLETEVDNGRSEDDIKKALNIVATDTQDSQTLVASLPAGAERDAIEQSLQQTLHSESETLYRLLARADWSLRVAFTQQLEGLGAPVPTVTNVSVNEGADDTLTLKLTGTNFAPGARLVIDGTPRGTVSQASQTELVAEVNGSDLPGGTYTIGVLNPDGTAAQVTLKGGDEHDNGSGDGGDHGGGQGTPNPTGTPGSGDDHDGGDGGSGGGTSGGSGSGSSSGGG